MLFGFVIHCACLLHFSILLISCTFFFCAIWLEDSYHHSIFVEWLKGSIGLQVSREMCLYLYKTSNAMCRAVPRIHALYSHKNKCMLRVHPLWWIIRIHRFWQSAISSFKIWYSNLQVPVVVTSKLCTQHATRFLFHSSLLSRIRISYTKLNDKIPSLWLLIKCYDIALLDVLVRIVYTIILIKYCQ